jgi:hypothetical protein
MREMPNGHSAIIFNFPFQLSLLDEQPSQTDSQHLDISAQSGEVN